MSGVLTVDKAYRQYIGAISEAWVYSSWTKENTAVFYSDVNLSDAKHLGTNYNPITKSNQLPITNYSGLRDNDVPGITVTGGSYVFPSLRIPKDVLTTVDATSFNAYLANHPLEITYELATPITHHLSPTQVNMLLGANTLWSDDGKVTLVYKAKKQ